MANRSEKLCICKICNCGRHHCPHQTQRQVPYGECMLTEYNNRYVPHAIEMTRSYKPAANPAVSDGPLSDLTTHRADYISHALERPFHHQADEYQAPRGEMESTTMYMKDFVEKRPEKQWQKKKEERNYDLERFEGEATYKSDYRKWELPKVEQSKTNHLWAPPQDPFEGLPTYSTDYIPHRVQMLQSFKPTAAAVAQDSPFDGITDYRQSYVAHPLEMREAHKKEEWQPPNVTFEGLTTFQRDYTHKEGGKALSCKPPAQAIHSQEPLLDETTMRNDYKSWQIGRPSVHQHEAYRKPEGDIDFSTTYFRDFHDHPLVKQAQMRQKERKRDSNIQFEGTTDYRENYRTWKVGPREKAGPTNSYESPQIPFEGVSTFQAHYVPQKFEMTRSYKPENSAKMSSEPFVDGTTYRLEYTAKERELCPAAVIDTPRSNYVFKEKDSEGHLMYEAMKMPHKPLFVS